MSTELDTSPRDPRVHLASERTFPLVLLGAAMTAAAGVRHARFTRRFQRGERTVGSVLFLC